MTYATSKRPERSKSLSDIPSSQSQSRQRSFSNPSIDQSQDSSLESQESPGSKSGFDFRKVTVLPPDDGAKSPISSDLVESGKGEPLGSSKLSQDAQSIQSPIDPQSKPPVPSRPSPERLKQVQDALKFKVESGKMPPPIPPRPKSLKDSQSGVLDPQSSPVKVDDPSSQPQQSIPVISQPVPVVSQPPAPKPLAAKDISAYFGQAKTYFESINTSKFRQFFKGGTSKSDRITRSGVYIIQETSKVTSSVLHQREVFNTIKMAYKNVFNEDLSVTFESKSIVKAQDDSGGALPAVDVDNDGFFGKKGELEKAAAVAKWLAERSEASSKKTLTDLNDTSSKESLAFTTVANDYSPEIAGEAMEQLQKDIRRKIVEGSKKKLKSDKKFLSENIKVEHSKTIKDEFDTATDAYTQKSDTAVDKLRAYKADKLLKDPSKSLFKRSTKAETLLKGVTKEVTDQAAEEAISSIVEPAVDKGMQGDSIQDNLAELQIAILGVIERKSSAVMKSSVEQLVDTDLKPSVKTTQTLVSQTESLVTKVTEAKKSNKPTGEILEQLIKTVASATAQSKSTDDVYQKRLDLVKPYFREKLLAKVADKVKKVGKSSITRVKSDAGKATETDINTDKAEKLVEATKVAKSGLKKKVHQVVEAKLDGSMSVCSKKLGSLIGFVIPNPGDNAKLTVRINIPLKNFDPSGTLAGISEIAEPYLTFAVAFELEKLEELKAVAAVTIGAGVSFLKHLNGGKPLGDCLAEIGAFTEIKAKTPDQVGTLFSYGLYQQMKRFSEKAANYLWFFQGLTESGDSQEAALWEEAVNEDVFGVFKGGAKTEAQKAKAKANEKNSIELAGTIGAEGSGSIGASTLKASVGAKARGRFGTKYSPKSIAALYAATENADKNNKVAKDKLSNAKPGVDENGDLYEEQVVSVRENLKIGEVSVTGKIAIFDGSGAYKRSRGHIMQKVKRKYLSGPKKDKSETIETEIDGGTNEHEVKIIANLGAAPGVFSAATPVDKGGQIVSMIAGGLATAAGAVRTVKAAKDKSKSKEETVATGVDGVKVGTMAGDNIVSDIVDKSGLQEKFASLATQKDSAGKVNPLLNSDTNLNMLFKYTYKPGAKAKPAEPGKPPVPAKDGEHKVDFSLNYLARFSPKVPLEVVDIKIKAEKLSRFFRYLYENKPAGTSHKVELLGVDFNPVEYDRTAGGKIKKEAMPTTLQDKEDAAKKKESAKKVTAQSLSSPSSSQSVPDPLAVQQINAPIYTKDVSAVQDAIRKDLRRMREQGGCWGDDNAIKTIAAARKVRFEVDASGGKQIYGTEGTIYKMKHVGGNHFDIYDSKNRLVSIPGDGDCLFAAMAKLLGKSTAQGLRVETADKMDIADLKDVAEGQLAAINTARQKNTVPVGVGSALMRLVGS